MFMRHNSSAKVMSFHKFSELPFLMNLVFAPEFLAMLHQDWQEHQIWFAAPQTL
jgi:hypothetical protein